VPVLPLTLLLMMPQVRVSGHAVRPYWWVPVVLDGGGAQRQQCGVARGHGSGAAQRKVRIIHWLYLLGNFQYRSNYENTGSDHFGC
jgi:hypothetical protein